VDDITLLSWIERAKNVSALLVVIGVAGEFLGDFIAAPINRRIEAARSAELATLNKQAASANERTGQLERENLLLQQELLKLRRESEPRRLTGPQKVKLTELLRGHPDGVVVVSALTDPEFADFDAALRDAQWETLRVSNRLSSAYGVSVDVVPGGRDRPGARVLSEALTAIGVPHHNVAFTDGDPSTSPHFQAGHIYLVIEHKPQIIASRSASN
jgi:hypothetical protein